MSESIRQEILKLEKQYWEAIRNKDGATATRLSDARCLVIGPPGIGEPDRKALAGMVENQPHELKKWHLDDDELMVDGKPTTLEAFDSSVWVKRDGGWVCAAHTETLAGDPYGRNEGRK